MTNSNIKNFAKVCKVSSIISQVCQIQKLDWLEKTLLNQWFKIVFEKQSKDYEDLDVAFILAKYDFLDYLRSDENCMSNEPITPFLVDTIQSLF